MFAAVAFALALQTSAPPGPIEFGRADLERALQTTLDTGVRDVTIKTLQLPRIGSDAQETYRVEFVDGQVAVTGSDANGLMYGLLEAAERIRNGGKDAWKQPVVTGKPYLAERGWNMFLPLPWDYEKNFIDNDPAALTDPARWFFMNDDYWRTLFDQMARSRLNWLDIHGPYDLDTTRFPNLYAYFIQSDKYPQVGVAPEIKAKLLAQLNRVIGMAHARGVKVSLMSYEARFDVPHNLKPPYKGDEAEVYEYTKEVVEKMIRQAPGLDKIGFRIGESGRGPEFFNCYLEAVKASGRDIPVYTRSWVTRKAKVVPLAKASKDFTVEIKYNGEHWGAPYILAGGRSANWYSYFYEDYLSYSGSDGAAKMWPGVPIDDFRLTIDDSRKSASEPNRQSTINNRQSTWPSQPYKIVWQVRANGTHRIFPFYNPEWTRRSVLSMKMGTTTGYTVESLASYFPQEPRFYWKGPKLPYTWIHQRDEMYMTCWGRLGYDPQVPEWKFDAMLVKRFGQFAGGKLATGWKSASKIVPMSFLAHSLGPDHRSHAPELETGGDLFAHLQGSPFDSFAFMGAREAAALRASGGNDGRLTPREAASLLNSIILRMGGFSARTIPEMAELHAALTQVRNFGQYAATMLSGAQDLALAEAGHTLQGSAGNRQPADSAKSAEQSWRWLSEREEAKSYRPFTDRLRMRRHDFHWSTLLPAVQDQASRAGSISADYQPIRTELDLFESIRESGRSPTEPQVRPRVETGPDEVKVSVPRQGLKAAYLLHKPLPSTTFFHKTAMMSDGSEFRVALPRMSWGHALALEVVLESGVARRLPWWGDEQPYIVIPAQEKPTPPIYSSEEAMAFLKPEILNPSKHGSLLLGTRAWNFHRRFDKSTQRKLLTAVERGLDLVIMQQDFASGRYPLDWLPAKPTIVNRPTTVFDPAGALGMEKIETADILWQPIEPGNGWEVHGNGGVASLKHGKGTIWIVQARLVQRMHIPAAARSLKALLKSCNVLSAPVILVDAATENGDSADSIIPDFMNAHDIPFLTLGEVIAQEQGMDSLTPIPGPVATDDILKGQGKDMANRWLKAQVVKAAKRPTPSSLGEFEEERVRRKRVLLQSLGLDPAPPRTLLNARITGRTIQREGYIIEKLVYESRPNFFVTAHLYRPDQMPAGKLPVIVNVNGHWAHKKNEDRIQLRAAFQALQGYMALAIDSPGHSFEGNAPIERRSEGNHNDWKLFFGTNATGIYVWDVIRGLDYLETRSDVDMSRIGLTGASGGGLATLYAFAAEDRFSAAASVVYMSSMELAPDNGCLCNHVPGTSQIGDRSDIAAIQAPKPFLIMGAENDPEFPPNAMQLTGKKMAETWALFDKTENFQTIIFPGGHDYNQPMREASLGFFNKHLRGTGDGSPVPQPALEALPHDDLRLLALLPLPNNEATMRDVTREYLRASEKPATRESLVSTNGGIAFESAKYRENESGARRTFTLETGAVTAPGVLIPRTQEGFGQGVRIYLDDRGKHELLRDHDAEDERERPKIGNIKIGGGPYDISRFSVHRAYFDPFGFGELSGVEGRYLAYLGASTPFLAANQVVLLAKELRRLGQPVVIYPNGPVARLVAVYACILDPELHLHESATPPRRTWQELVRDDYPDFGFQPRAHLIGTLESLFKLVEKRAP